MSIEVRRNANFTLLAVKAVLKVPIVWMSGDYKWSRAYIMTFLPYKAKGHFNIDLRDVEIGREPNFYYVFFTIRKKGMTFH